MRYLIVSDLHGNWPALEAVLAAARDYEKVLFLGDAVGYYPDGEKVVGWLRSVGAVGIMGNHDDWLVKIDGLEVEGPILEILAWQAERLSPANLEYLSALPWTRHLEDALLVHGSPCDPLAYLENTEQAKNAFGCTEARITFHGHTHHAGAYTQIKGPNGDWIRFQRCVPSADIIVAPKARIIANPGSVGQPRDGMPGAAYLIWDSKEDNLEYHRASYDLEAVLGRIEEEGFPYWLYDRLLMGR